MVLILIATTIRLAQRPRQPAFLLDSTQIKVVLFSDARSGSVDFKSIVPDSMDMECLDVVLHGDCLPGGCTMGTRFFLVGPFKDAVLWGF